MTTQWNVKMQSLKTGGLLIHAVSVMFLYTQGS